MTPKNRNLTPCLEARFERGVMVVLSITHFPCGQQRVGIDAMGYGMVFKVSSL